MSTKKLSILLIAVLTALIFTACGQSDASLLEPGSENGIKTFGEEFSAFPEESPNAFPAAPNATPNTTGNVAMPGLIEDDNGNSDSSPTPGGNSANSSGGASSGGSSSGGGSGNGSSGGSGGSSGGISGNTTPVSPSPTPNNDPVAPSNATADEVRNYIGKPLTDLIAALGYPISSEYSLLNEEDPERGEIGTLRFNGFTAITLRMAEGEVIQTVIEDETPSEAPASPAPSPSPKP